MVKELVYHHYISGSFTSISTLHLIFSLFANKPYGLLRWCLVGIKPKNLMNQRWSHCCHLQWKLVLNSTWQDMSIAHRIRTGRNKKPHPIVVRFTSRNGEEVKYIEHDNHLDSRPHPSCLWSLWTSSLRRRLPSFSPMQGSCHRPNASPGPG